MRKVLAIGTHPDDIEIGCGGVLCRLQKRGFELHFAIATLGEEGVQSAEPAEVLKIRKEEALRSAEVLGVRHVEFLGLPDGLQATSKEDKIRLVELIRTIRPEILFIHAATDQFPDHQVIHKLSRSAILAAQGPWYPGAKGSPHKASAVFGFEVWNPINQCQLSIDISDELETKLAALAQHRSQLETIRYDLAVQGLAAYRGAMTGKGRFAEAFEVIELSAGFHTDF